MPTLQELREAALISRPELAKFCEVSAQTIYYWERARAVPRMNHRRKLVEILKSSPEAINAAIRETEVRYKDRAA